MDELPASNSVDTRPHADLPVVAEQNRHHFRASRYFALDGTGHGSHTADAEHDWLAVTSSGAAAAAHDRAPRGLVKRANVAPAHQK